jgi:hypothetical protein
LRLKSKRITLNPKIWIRINRDWVFRPYD